MAYVDWYLEGPSLTSCNCDWGCPCQFNSPTTHGRCEAVGAGVVEEGYFNETRLDGLRFVLLLQWPGEIAEGNGRQQAIIDVRADAAQREALRKIVYGESTKPGATAFYVYNSTMSEVLPPVYAPIEFEMQLDARRARLRVPGLVESDGSPIVDPHSGNEYFISAWLAEEHRKSLTDLENILLTTRNGEPVLLKNLASLKLNAGPVKVDRKHFQRVIHVTANPINRALGDVAKDLESAFAKLQLPAGFSIKLAGQVQQQRETFEGLQ